MAYIATSLHHFFRSVDLIFLLRHDPSGGGALLLLSFFMFYFTLFHFLGFSYHLCFSLLFYFETCMQAWRLTGSWRCTHDRLFFFMILIFCTVMPPHPLSVRCIISFFLLRILWLIISKVGDGTNSLFSKKKEYHHISMHCSSFFWRKCVLPETLTLYTFDFLYLAWEQYQKKVEMVAKNLIPVFLWITFTFCV